MITKFKLFENKQNPSIIDYTYLKKNSNIDELIKICENIKDSDIYSIVVHPENVGTVKTFLEDTNILVTTVIDFPKGNSNTNFKANELDEAIINGTDEVDVVFNYKHLKELIILKEEEYTKQYDVIIDELETLTRIAHKAGIIIKMIIEIEELHYEQIKIACEICEKASVDFVQTSTGFSKKTPNWNEKIEKTKYMRKILPNYINLKVAGGIRNQSQIDELKQIGVDRIGTSIII